MAIQAPTIAAVRQQIIDSLEASLNQTISLFPKAFNRVIAAVFAGVFILLYKHSNWIFLQLFVATATIDEVEILGRVISPLKEWGRLIGAGDPVGATQAQLSIDIAVEVQTGQLDSGTQVVHSSTGVLYLLQGSILLDASTVTGTFVAASDQGGDPGDGSGVIGNLEVGAVVQFANPLANVARDAVVSGVLVTGADPESVEAYRQRIIDLFQKRRQGGALVDYEIWGEELVGIINVYPYTGTIPGTVESYVEATVASSGNPDGIPTQAQLDLVLEAINKDEEGKASRRPANAFPIVLPITRTGFEINVKGLIVEEVGTVKSTIDAAVVQYFLDREPFIDGVTVLARTDLIARLSLVGLIEDIVTAANGTFTGVLLALTSGGGPIPVYALGVGEKSKLTTAVVFSG